MPPQKITEQQFRTRRRDRRMVWVDAAAAGLGLVLLIASVGGVIVLEPEEQPILFSVNWFEGKETDKFCVDCEVARVGGTLLDLNPAKEGVEFQIGGFPVIEKANITRVVFTLEWLDDQPLDNDGTRRKYDYTNESVDVLELRVETPWGETVVLQGANEVPKHAGDVAPGRLQVEWNFTELPTVKKWPAFSMEEAQSGLMANFTVATYEALDKSPLGEWDAVVTVLQAGDQKGTVPSNVCHSERLGTDVPTEVEDALPGPGEPPRDLRTPYEGACDTRSEQAQNDASIPKDVQGESTYRSTYVDEGNAWVLQRNIWSYSSQVSY